MIVLDLSKHCTDLRCVWCRQPIEPRRDDDLVSRTFGRLCVPCYEREQAYGD